MNDNKAPTLRQLTMEQQRQIIVWLQTYSRHETIEFIASQYGVKVSERTLGRFRAWWHVTRSLELAAEYADALRDRLNTPEQNAAQNERIQEAAQVAFELAAVERQDLAAFVSLRKLRQRDKAIEIARQRLQAATSIRSSIQCLPPAPDWTEEHRQAVMRKVDEVFGIAQEPAAPSSPSPSSNPPPCPQ